MTPRNRVRSGRGGLVLALLALIFLPWPVTQATAGGVAGIENENKRKKEKETVDNYITAISIANPAAGAFFKVFNGFVLWAWDFGRDRPDAIVEALKQIHQRLDEHEARIAALEVGVLKVQSEVFRNANLQRVRQLRAHRVKVERVLLQLQQQPRDKNTRVLLAHDAQVAAEEFLVDSDLWLWSDLVARDHSWQGQPRTAGQLLKPEFKPWPAMESYALALITWMTAIEYAGDGDRTWVRQTYGQEIRKHVAFLTVRPGWDEVKDAPETLPENIKARISVSFHSDRYPEKKVCSFIELTTDLISREIKTVVDAYGQIETISYLAREDNELCTVPYGFWHSRTAAAEELEQAHGTGLMWSLAEKLTRLKDSGTVREPFIGTFPLGKTKIPAVLYGVRPDGRIAWHRHEDARLVPGAGQPEEWKVASPSGSGWDGFRHVVPGGRSVIYGVTRDGKLLWYQHTGSHSGDGKGWEGGKEIASGGWGDFTQVFSGGSSGVLYGISRAGKLVWYRHTGHATGARTWEGGKEIGSGWGDFRHVFSTADGIIYAVTSDGKLLWYKHTGYANGAKAWEGPKEIAGGGWADFKKVFAAGNGIIYAVTRAGKLVWYQHTGYSTGTREWKPGREVAGGWGDFSQTLALLPDNVLTGPN